MSSVLQMCFDASLAYGLTFFMW